MKGTPLYRLLGRGWRICAHEIRFPDSGLMRTWLCGDCGYVGRDIDLLRQGAFRANQP